MDMSKHPGPDTTTAPTTTPTTELRPGDAHKRDMSNPGELWGFVLAVALIGGLGLGYLFGGLPGLALVMVAIVPVIYVVLVTISAGR